MFIRSTLTAIALATVVTGCAAELDVRPEPAHEDDDLDSELRLGRDGIDGFGTEGELRTSPVLAVAEGANRVALMLEASIEGLTVLARGVDGDDVGPWVEVEWTFAEEGLKSGRAELTDVWAAVQIAVPSSSSSSLQQITFSGVFVEDVADVGLDTVEEAAAQPLAPALAFVGVEPRSSWGARGTRCSTRDGSFTRMALHHTASRNTGNVGAMARQIQSYHMDGRGYCDAAYHFAVSQDGRILELRELPFRGGHTLNNNTGNIGVVFMGCFDPACGNDQPSAQLLEKGAGIVAMLSRLHGIPVDSNRVRGHRDHSGAQTACPGAHLHPRLEQIRSRARAILGTTQPSAPPPAAGPAPSGCGTLTANTVLGRGQARTSCDGRVTLAHQGDGNVVVYDAARGGRAVWSTGTHGRATTALVMQGDGNFVLYNGGQVLWASGTHGRPGASVAVQDDGNVVIYAPGPRAVWSTGTNR